MKYEYWLSAIKPISDSKKLLLRERFVSAEELYYIEEKILRKLEILGDEEVKQICESRIKWNLTEEYEKLVKADIKIITYFDEAYPEKLKHIFQPPYALYVKGYLPEPSLPSIAIVGARKCTAYGEKCAMDFASELTEGGAQIISGLAMGIDGIGQRAALNQDGKTYAILGSGVDVCYPRTHIGLYMDILEHEGGIISEQLPGTDPIAWNFPLRNRIISGLSDAVLVIEAKEKSGSLITADFAMEQGKDVYALPGPVTSAYSQGCNRLIKQGAGILLTPDELIQDLMISKKIDLQISRKKDCKKEIMLERTEKLVYSGLGFDSKNLDTIAKETGLPMLKVMNVLISLELRGLVKEISKNNYVKI